MNIPYIFSIISHGLQIHEKIRTLQEILSNKPINFSETKTDSQINKILESLASYLKLFPSPDRHPSDIKELLANLVEMYGQLDIAHKEIVRLKNDKSFMATPDFYRACDLTMQCSQTFLSQVMNYFTIALEASS